MVRLPCASPETEIRPRRNGRAIQPTQHSPSSTASVALCVAAAKAVRANSRHFSMVDVRSPCTTRMKSDSTDRPAKMSVSSVLASQGSEVVRISTRLTASSRNGREHAEHAQRQLQDPQRRQRLDPEVDPEARILAEMEIEAERRRAAGHQVAFVPPRQIAAGIPLEQRIAIPQGRGEQHQGDGDGRDPGRPRIGSGPRPQNLRVDVASPQFGPPCREWPAGRNSPIVGRRSGLIS